MDTDIIAEVHSTIALIKSLEDPPGKGVVWENLASKSSNYAELGRKLSEVVYAHP